MVTPLEAIGGSDDCSKGSQDLVAPAISTAEKAWDLRQFATDFNRFKNNDETASSFSCSGPSPFSAKERARLQQDLLALNIDTTQAQKILADLIFQSDSGYQTFACPQEFKGSGIKDAYAILNVATDDADWLEFNNLLSQLDKGPALSPEEYKKLALGLNNPKLAFGSAETSADDLTIYDFKCHPDFVDVYRLPDLTDSSNRIVLERLIDRAGSLPALIENYADGFGVATCPGPEVQKELVLQLLKVNPFSVSKTATAAQAITAVQASLKALALRMSAQDVAQIFCDNYQQFPDGAVVLFQELVDRNLSFETRWNRKTRIKDVIITIEKTEYVIPDTFTLKYTMQNRLGRFDQQKYQDVLNQLGR